MKLDISYEKIDRFVESMLQLKPNFYDLFAKKISLGWKFHIIRFCLKEYIYRQKFPIGATSEQTSEAVHKNLNKTLKRFVAVCEKNVYLGEKFRDCKESFKYIFIFHEYISFLVTYCYFLQHIVIFKIHIETCLNFYFETYICIVSQ